MVNRTIDQAKGVDLPWWLVLVEGVALSLLGILLMLRPGMTSAIVMQLLGLNWLVAGVLKIVSIFIDSEIWIWKLCAGVVGIIAGILSIEHPFWSAIMVGNTLFVWLGLGGLFFGAASLFQAARGVGWARGVLGFVSLLFGVVLLADARGVALSLSWVLGLSAFAGGNVTIAAAIVKGFSRPESAGSQRD